MLTGGTFAYMISQYTGVMSDLAPVLIVSIVFGFILSMLSK